MKSLLLSWVWLLAGVTSVTATPDRQIIVEEDLLGSNATGFLILRTVSDNRGSYYSDHSIRYLDEYEKKPQTQPIESTLARRVKRTVLLDVATSRDYPDDGGPMTVSENVKEQDGDIKLAELLRRFPQRPRRWLTARRKKLESWKHDEDIYSGQFQVLSKYDISSEVFDQSSYKGFNYRIQDVMEDSNSIFLRMTTGIDDEVEQDEMSSQSRWVCLVPEATQRVRDHLELPPQHLCTGYYKGAGEAAARVRELLKQDVKKHLYDPPFEVWKISGQDTEAYFTVVIRCDLESIRPERFEELKKQIAPDLSPISTQHFIQKDHTPLR